MGRRGLEGASGERDGEGEMEGRGRLAWGESFEEEKGEKADGEGSTEQRYAAGADMASWFAGRVALPRPVALGTLGVRVMVERTVARGRVDDEDGKGEGEEEEEAAELEGPSTGAAEEEAGVETGELRLDEEGEDLPVPLAWPTGRAWLWPRLSDSNCD